ncbi:hypothetical protein T265_15965, partial [Opisthorchis viverrini]
VVDGQLPETTKDDESPAESIDSPVVTEKSQTDSASQSGVGVSQNQSASNGAGAGGSLETNIPAPPGSVTQPTSANTTLTQAEPNKDMLNKTPEEDASKLQPDSSDPPTPDDKQTGLGSGECTHLLRFCAIH